MAGEETAVDKGADLVTDGEGALVCEYPGLQEITRDTGLPEWISETPGQTLGKLHFAGVNVPLLGHHPSGVVLPLYVVFPFFSCGQRPRLTSILSI